VFGVDFVLDLVLVLGADLVAVVVFVPNDPCESAVRTGFGAV
jgi:hypothetical protein